MGPVVYLGSLPCCVASMGHHCGVKSFKTHLDNVLCIDGADRSFGSVTFWLCFAARVCNPLLLCSGVYDSFLCLGDFVGIWCKIFGCSADWLCDSVTVLLCD